MDVFGRHDLYRQRLLAAVPHVLTQLDRDPFSSTYGCFDREYWAWATKDFSNVDLQRAIYPLTLLYLLPFEGNHWQGNSRVKDWILAAFNFWQGSQHRNGSHDHHYPNEFSFVGVAFPLYEIAESFRLLVEAGELEATEQERWVRAMARGADFLCRRDELHGFISNHRLGAACALHAMYRITGEERFRTRAQALVDSVRLRASDAEGWLYEYGGADPGYQTLATYYLANYLRLTEDEGLFDEIAAPSVRFLQYFIHPDGSVGGEYGSRNCPLYFPSGLELLAKRSSEAEAVAALAAEGIADGNTPALADADIRNFVPLLSSYAQALVASGQGGNASAAELPPSRRFERYWPQAGFFVRSDEHFYTVVGCSKGGVVKVFDKAQRRLLASHAGYMAKTREGRRLSTQFLTENSLQGAEDCVGTEAQPKNGRTVSLRQPFFSVIHDRTATALKFLLFRLFTRTFGRNLWLADWVKRNIITKLFIHRRHPAGPTLRRELTFATEGPSIVDSFEGLDLDRLESLRAGDIFTTIYMASAKYYRDQEALGDVLSKTELAGDLRRFGPTLYYRLSDGSLQRLDSGSRSNSPERVAVAGASHPPDQSTSAGD